MPSQDDLLLHDDRHAETSTDALPIGSGRLGGMVVGGSASIG